MFIDENGNTISLYELVLEYKALQAEDPDTYNYSFAEYIANCTDKNGTLTRI